MRSRAWKMHPHLQKLSDADLPVDFGFHLSCFNKMTAVVIMMLSHCAFTRIDGKFIFTFRDIINTKSMLRFLYIFLTQYRYNSQLSL